MTNEARIVDPKTARTFETPQGEDVVALARGDDPGEDYDVLEFTILREPGAVPLHVHHENDEAFYVLEGELLFQLGDDRHRLTAGSYAFGPRGIPHAYRNIGGRPARILVIYIPGDFVSFTEELEDLGPFNLEDESDRERVLPIFEEYGIEMVGPPIQEGTR